MVLLPIMSHPSVKCPVLWVGYVSERWLSELLTAEETCLRVVRINFWGQGCQLGLCLTETLFFCLDISVVPIRSFCQGLPLPLLLLGPAFSVLIGWVDKPYWEGLEHGRPIRVEWVVIGQTCLDTSRTSCMSHAA